MPKPQGSFSYVYRLNSVSHPSECYTGLTDDLASRLAAHNSGQSKHTARYRPRHIEVAISFRSRDKAAAFEKYLKSGSGRAFAKKHF